MQVKSLDHIHIYSADPESSALFYADHFDAREFVRNNNVNGDLRIFLALGDQVLVVGSFPAGITPATPPEVGDGAFIHGFGIAHFGLRVDDLASAASELGNAGVKLCGEIVREDSGLAYTYLEAPDGVVIELTEYE